MIRLIDELSKNNLSGLLLCESTKNVLKDIVSIGGGVHYSIAAMWCPADPASALLLLNNNLI